MIPAIDRLPPPMVSAVARHYELKGPTTVENLIEIGRWPDVRRGIGERFTNTCR